MAWLVRHRERLTPWLAIGAVWCFFYAPPLVQNRGFSFRDTATFYLPRYSWAAAERARLGRPPLWNDQIGIGAPVIAEATYASFYPAQLLFHLPTSDVRRMVLYLSLHSLLAAVGGYLLARRLACDRAPATLAAVAYAFGGSVLFQHCNVVFLVGAAWLPWSLHSLLGLMQTGGCERWRSLLWWSATLALMVLGGDPQMAYHVSLLAGLAWFCGVGRTESIWSAASAGQVSRLTAGATLALALAAMQVLPSAIWSRESTRALRDQPRSIYELAADQWRGAPASTADLFGEADSGHGGDAYQFSVAPWRWIEWLWPNSTGRLFPENRRWIKVIPAEGRTWSPSLYLGAATMLLALAGVSRQSTRRWLSLLTLLAVLATLGRFGIGWLLSEVEHAISGDVKNRFGVGSHVGGVYWLLNVLLPGYVYFRYPAKWMVIAALGATLLAACGWQRCLQDSERRRQVRWVLCGWGLLSLIAAATVWFGSPRLAELLETHHRTESFFGPFSGSGACRDLWQGMLQAAVVCFATGLLLGEQTWRRTVLVALLAVELCLANAWLTPTTPAAAWQTVAAFPATTSHQRVYRSNESGWLPAGWTQRRHDDILGEALEWNATTLYPQLHLLHPNRVGVVNARSSIESSRWASWLAVARDSGAKGRREVRLPHLEAISVDWILTDPSSEWQGRHASLVLDQRLAADAIRLKVSPHPRAWFVDRIEWVESISNGDRSQLQTALRRILARGRRTGFERLAVVERDPFPVGPTPPDVLFPETTELQLVSYQPDRQRWSIVTSRPLCLVLNQLHTSGWTARTIDDFGARSTPVFRANGVMQAVLVPAGKSDLQLEYRPPGLRVGLLISGVAALAWLAAFCFLSILPSSPTEDNEESLDSIQHEA